MQTEKTIENLYPMVAKEVENERINKKNCEPRRATGSHGSYGELRGATGSYGELRGATGSYGELQGATGSYRELPKAPSKERRAGILFNLLRFGSQNHRHWSKIVPKTEENLHNEARGDQIWSPNR